MRVSSIPEALDSRLILKAPIPSRTAMIAKRALVIMMGPFGFCRLDGFVQQLEADFEILMINGAAAARNLGAENKIKLVPSCKHQVDPIEPSCVWIAWRKHNHGQAGFAENKVGARSTEG